MPGTHHPGRRVFAAAAAAALAFLGGSIELAKLRGRARDLELYDTSTRLCRAKVEHGADPTSEFWCYRARQLYASLGPASRAAP